jgi:hypothetical protein
MFRRKQGIFGEVDCASNPIVTLSLCNNFGVNWSEWRAVA